MTDDPYARFAELGEGGVKHELARDAFNDVNKRLAITWLEQKAQDRSDASQAESLAIASSSKDAAWVAADAARVAAREAKTANTIAKLALVAAVIAIAVSVIGLFHP
jgi:hypothetical protein